MTDTEEQVRRAWHTSLYGRKRFTEAELGQEVRLFPFADALGQCGVVVTLGDPDMRLTVVVDTRQGREGPAHVLFGFAPYKDRVIQPGWPQKAQALRVALFDLLAERGLLPAKDGRGW